jgi:hypothetical protein
MTLRYLIRGKVLGSSLLVEGLVGDKLLGENSEDSHHGGTSVVKLSVLLTELLGWLLVPVVDLSKPDTVVAIKLGSRPPGKLNKCSDDKDLEESSGRDLEESSDTRVDISELDSLGWGDVTIESPLVVVNKGSEHGHHGDTSVLTLDSAVTLELSIIGDVTKRIEESKRSGSTNLGGLSIEGNRGSL